MTNSRRGLHEVLLTEALEWSVRKLDAGLEGATEGLRPAEAAERIALHLGRLVERIRFGARPNV